MLGPALAGVLSALAGPAVAIAVDAGTWLVLALSYARVALLMARSASSRQPAPSRQRRLRLAALARSAAERTLLGRRYCRSRVLPAGRTGGRRRCPLTRQLTWRGSAATLGAPGGVASVRRWARSRRPRAPTLGGVADDGRDCARLGCVLTPLVSPRRCGWPWLRSAPGPRSGIPGPPGRWQSFQDASRPADWHRCLRRGGAADDRCAAGHRVGRLHGRLAGARGTLFMFCTGMIALGAVAGAALVLRRSRRFRPREGGQVLAALLSPRRSGSGRAPATGHRACLQLPVR